jgi:hypothetical protein
MWNTVNKHIVLGELHPFDASPIWGLLLVGTKIWNSVLNEPGEGCAKVFYLNRKKQFQEEYHDQKFVCTTFTF